ncbi:Myosin-2, partial [Cucurbita argyrosperma subsp. sororia]
MMLSPSPSTIARSSLEEMLDSLRRRDEIDKPKDAPPALPSRPTSKARTPPVGRALPVNFRRLNRDQDEESPYMLASENENGDRMNGSNLRGSYWEDNIGYFLQKLSKSRVYVFRQRHAIRNSMFGVNFQTDNGSLGTIQSSTGAEASVMLSNKKNLLPANPDIIEGVDDLVQLGFLNEPSVLHSLHRRFSQDKIYSNAGSVLIAFNPLKDIKHGESGAGKTETAKAVLEYLTSLGGVSGIDDRISRANVILEAFGNAKTSRNNNASRFGKLIETLFSRTGKICGAVIQTYRREKHTVYCVSS